MNTSNSTGSYEYQKKDINWYYAICEILVAIVAVIGNALVIFVFRKERRLRRRTNYYIVSLAAADFLVGLLGIPFAIMSSIGLPANLHACLFTVSLLVVLCTISIFCLVAVSVDRYWAILYPMGYSRNVRTKTAIVIISICWVMGSFVGFLPLMGWHKDARSDESCFFLDVMDYNYLVFLYFCTIITPALLLAAFYAHIYQVVLKQLRQIVTMNPESGTTTPGCSSGGTMLRMLGAAQKREVKATQNLAIIVLFFMICWIPLYTINCILAFCKNCNFDSTFMLSCIILSHLNSAGNPLLYAYHLKDFRQALKNFFYNLFGFNEVPNNRTTFVSNTYTYNNRLETKRKTYNRSQMFLTNNNKISTIIKSTANVATTAVDIDRKIWDIPEASPPLSTSPSSSSSGDSSEESLHHHDRLSMVRPATPYRPRQHSSQINQGYFNNIDEGSDDVFLNDTYIFNQLVDEHEIEMPSKQLKTISNSSPQLLLTKNLFLIESTTDTKPKFERSTSLVERHTNSSQNDDCLFNNNRIDKYRCSPFRMVNAVFRNNKQIVARSLSDDGTASDESIERRQNKTLIRSSCGS